MSHKITFPYRRTVYGAINNRNCFVYYVTDKEELRVYLAGGLILNPEIQQGQYVIKYNDYVLGTAVVTSGGIKSRFPRSKRTQKVRLGEFESYPAFP